MAKLSIDDKLNIIRLRKEGLSWSSLVLKYNINKSVIVYFYRLVEIHGIEVLYKREYLRHPKAFKEYCINQVLIEGSTITSVALHEGLLSKSMLIQWIKKYKENGYNVVEKKRGRRRMKSNAYTDVEKTMNKEEIQILKRENEYLRAEIEFLKKWNAVVQSEEKRKQKK